MSAITFMNQPDNSHFQDMLNKRATELTKICICHVIWDTMHTKKRLSLNLKGIEQLYEDYFVKNIYNCQTFKS